LTFEENMTNYKTGTWTRPATRALVVIVFAALNQGCSSSNNGGTGGNGGAAGHAGAAGTDGGLGGQDGGNSNGDGAVADMVPRDAPPPTMLDFPFATGTDMFDVDRQPTTNPLNLGAVVPDGGGPASADFDGTVGMPTPGSLHITATFTDYDQLVSVRRVFSTPPNNDTTINLTNKTINAQIRLDPPADGGTTRFSGVARLFALSTPVPPNPSPGFYLAEGASVILGDNNWHMITLRVSSPDFADARFDPTDIVQVGLHLVTLVPTTSVDAAPAPFGDPQPISIHFDSVVSN
jgi:hypothetical protein